MRPVDRLPGESHVAWLRRQIGTGLTILPAVTAMIRGDDGQILLQLHADTGEWGLPGGAVEPEEAPEEAVVREVREETGLEVVVESLVGVYGGPDSTVRYRNGDLTSYIRTVYAVRVVGGTLRLDGDESLELRWTTAADRADLVIPAITARILAHVERTA
jgi:8-oxo-dGTP diphosphatase